MVLGLKNTSNIVLIIIIMIMIIIMINIMGYLLMYVHKDI